MSGVVGHAQSTSRLRMRASRNAPAKAAPTSDLGPLERARLGRRAGRGAAAPRRGGGRGAGSVSDAHARATSRSRRRRSRRRWRRRGLARRRSASAACSRAALGLGLRPLGASRAALRSLRESFSSSLCGGLDGLVRLRRSPPRRGARRWPRARCAARRRGPRRARARRPRSACSAAAARVASSAGVVLWSSLTPADLPRRRGGKSRPRRVVVDDRGERARCRRAGRPRPGA